MFVAEIVARLPVGVRMTDGALCDDELGQCYPMNRTASAALTMLLGGASMGDLATAVSRDAGVPAPQAQADVARLVEQLNRTWLLNVHRSTAPCLGLWHPVRAFRQWAFLRVARRRSPLPARAWCVPLAITAAVAESAAGRWLVMLAVLALLASLTAPEWLAYASAGAIGAFTAPIAHETGHAYAARSMASGAFLSVSAREGVAVVSGSGDRDGWVLAAGPTLAGAVGICVGTAGTWAGQPALSILALPFVAQLACLTVLGSDGRNLVSRREEA